MDHPCIVAPVPISPDYHNPIPFLFDSPGFVFYPSYPPVPPPRPKRALSPSQHLPPAKKRKLRAPPNSNLRPSCLSAPSVCPEVSKGFGLLTPLGSSRRPLSVVFAQANMGMNMMGMAPRGGLMALRKAAILNRIKREQMAARTLQQRQVEIARMQNQQRLAAARRNPKRRAKKERSEEVQKVLKQFEKIDMDEEGDSGMGDADFDLDAQNSYDSGDESASDAEMESGDEQPAAVSVVPIVPVVAEPEAVTKARRAKAAKQPAPPRPVRSRKKAQPVSVAGRLIAAPSTTPAPAPTPTVPTLPVAIATTRQTRSRSSSSSASARSRRNKSPEAHEQLQPSPQPQPPKQQPQQPERGRRRTRSQSANPAPAEHPIIVFAQPKPTTPDCPEFHSPLLSHNNKENHLTPTVITPSPSPSPPPLTTTAANHKKESKESPLPLNNAVRTIRREGLRSAKSMGNLKELKENESAANIKGGRKLRTVVNCRRPPSPPNEKVLERERRTRGMSSVA